MDLFRVTSYGLNVRTSPTSETDENLFRPALRRGNVVEKVDESANGRWFKVRIEENGIVREGWVASRYLAPTDAPDEDDIPEVEPPWMEIAQQEIGQKEMEGEADNPRIIEYLMTTTNISMAHRQQDETHWCSAFVNWCMIQAGYEGTNNAAARSWEHWTSGTSNNEARYGAIAVFRRLVDGVDHGFGHVGFFVKREGHQIHLLGGNQNDEVNITPRSDANLICYLHPNPLPQIPGVGEEDEAGAVAVEDIPYRALPNGRLYEASLQDRLDKIARLERLISDGEVESPAERIELERKINEARRDYTQASERARIVATMPIPHATDAGPSSNWKAAWSWTTRDRNGLYIADPAAPFNDARARNKPGEAQGSNIENVVKFLDVEHTDRYKPQGVNTFCTVFVYDATWLLNVEIPIRPNRAANNMCNWLAGMEGQANGWQKVPSVDEAQQLVNKGFVVIATQKRLGAGHVALVRPVPMDKQPIPGDAYIAQAGAENTSLTQVSDPFGNPEKVTYYMHA